MKSFWNVREAHPLGRNDRKRRIFTYVVIAKDEKEAIDIIRDRHDKDLGANHSEYRASAFNGNVVTTNVYLEDVPKKTPEPKNVVDRLGDTEKSILASLEDSEGWPGGWIWDTYSGTLRRLQRLEAKGYVDKVEGGGGARFVINEKGRKAIPRDKWRAHGQIAAEFPEEIYGDTEEEERSRFDEWLTNRARPQSQEARDAAWEAYVEAVYKLPNELVLPRRFAIGQIFTPPLGKQEPEVVWGFVQHKTGLVSQKQGLKDLPIMGPSPGESSKCGNIPGHRRWSPRDLIRAGWTYVGMDPEVVHHGLD